MYLDKWTYHAREDETKVHIIVAPNIELDCDIIKESFKAVGFIVLNASVEFQQYYQPFAGEWMTHSQRVRLDFKGHVPHEELQELLNIKTDKLLTNEKS